MVMPGGIAWGVEETLFGPALVEAVKNQTVPQTRLDDMATRILAGWLVKNALLVYFRCSLQPIGTTLVRTRISQKPTSSAGTRAHLATNTLMYRVTTQSLFVR